jgi:plastocyanin
MNMRLLLGAAFVGLLLLSPAEVGAALKQVGVHDRFFDPDRITVGVGGVVDWHNPGTQEAHNVRQDWALFYSGEVVTVGDFRVAFSSGTFHYFCEIHGGRHSGMDGRVVVPVEVTEGTAGPAFTVKWATSASKTGSRYDVQYRVGTGDWREWYKNTTKLKGAFGDGGSPEVPVPGTRYRFRARSQKGTNNNAVSGWSPVASFTP